MDVTKEEKVAQVEKILQSKLMQGSEVLRSLLRFLLVETIEGRKNPKEYLIATTVLGRGNDFDPQIDSAVRVQASRLRAKLLEYYSTDGKADKILIELPKGHYSLAFARNTAPYDLAADKPGGLNSEETAEAQEFRRDVALLWEGLLQPSKPTLVVFSNTIFHGTPETGFRLFNSLDQVSSNPSLPVLELVSGGSHVGRQPRVDHYTGVGEAMGIHYVGELLTRINQPFRVKRSLLLSWDDVVMENIVVVGSPAENLFLLDLPQPQDFVFRWTTDEQGQQVNAVFNTNPQPGERERYWAKHYGDSPSQVSEDYAVISLLKGLSERNRLLILGGINTLGTQAAVECVTKPKYVRDLLMHLNTAPSNEPPKLPDSFQVLIKVKISGGVPIHASYVTHHVLN